MMNFLDIAIGNWEAGATSRWAIPVCAEMMQATLPGECPMCHQPLTPRCTFGCHTIEQDAPVSLMDVLLAFGLVESKTEARRLITGGSVRLSGVVIKDPAALIGTPDQCITNEDFPVVPRWIHLRVGKQWPWIIRLIGTEEDARVASINESIDHHGKFQSVV